MTNTVNAQLRRYMVMKFLGKAWSHIHENYKKMIRNAWEKTGCLLTANGTDDDLVKPEGIADYAVLVSLVDDPHECLSEPGSVAWSKTHRNAE